MARLDDHLKLQRCPHCSVDNPNLFGVAGPINTISDDSHTQRAWRIYSCKRCGGVVIAWAYVIDGEIRGTIPDTEKIDSNLPSKVKAYLQQAIDSTFAPSGSVMLCASSVDAMLKEKGYLTGSLYSRINKASEDGLLTKEMATWAHQVRLEANDQRHSDEEAQLPTVDDAKKAIEFTKTLSEFLFVLPAKVARGILSTTSQ